VSYDTEFIALESQRIAERDVRTGGDRGISNSMSVMFLVILDQRGRPFEFLVVVRN
jgi:hypothetical protein